MTTVKNIYDFIDSIAPYSTQEDWDNSGHLVGDFRAEVNRVVIALDATNEVVEFARDVDAQLVITHHPVIFGGITELKSNSAVYNLANAGIAHICAHTNYDISKSGINFNLASILGLNEIKAIEDSFITVGKIDAPMSMDDFAEYVADKLDSAGIRYTDTDRMISTVAVGGGACEEYIEIAMKNADCFVTGDIKYHIMLDAQQAGYAVISAGHYETENQAFLMLKDELEQVFTDVEFIAAPTQNPVKSI